jgi:putative SOS response-associated peptidase YedK
MTGRYLLIADSGAVADAFGLPPLGWFPPRYNIAPGQPIGVVREVRGVRELALVRWGFVPSWAKDPRKFGPFVNARAEGIADKPAFRGAMQYRRCLVPASGWYHWEQGRDGSRRPWLIRPRDGGVIGLAGLWDPWLGADGSEVDGALVITMPAASDIAGIADRMPAVILPGDYDVWLDCARSPAGNAARLLDAPPKLALEAVPVSDRVNLVTNDDADLITPAG